MKRLKVATYNILHSFKKKEITESIVELVRDGIDIFALQEVVKENDKEFIGDLLLDALGNEWEGKFALDPITQDMSWGTAILYNKKCKMLSHKKISFDVRKLSFKDTLIFRFITGREERLYPRTFINAKFNFEGEVFYFSSIHQDLFGQMQGRMEDLEFYVKEKSESGNHPEIICGDFNAVDILNTGRERRKIREILGREFFDATADIPYSVDLLDVNKDIVTPFFAFIKKINPIKIHRKIDFIWVKNINVKSSRAYSFEASDHMPLVAELEFK